MRGNICPVSDDDPIGPIVGGLVFLVICAVVTVGAVSLYNRVRYGEWHPTVYVPEKPAVVQPAEKPYAQFPLLSKHCETCKQCANPISETGEEQGLCEEGFRLLQEDVRNSK